MQLKNAISQKTRWANSKVLAAVAIGAASVSSAQAAAVDVSSVVSDIGAQAAPIGLIGGAVLLIFVGVKAFKWVRSALS